MKRADALLIFFVVTLLTACAAKPIDDRYYSLVLAGSETAYERADEAGARRAIVGPIEIPAYLDKRGLAIQTGSNQIQTANHHFWAEPLAEAMSKVLVRDLSQLSDGLAFEREAGRWNSAGDCRLRFEFDKFHATAKVGVVTSGRFWILSEGSTVSREFNLRRTLSADGHAHAVTALRQSLLEVAHVVVTAMKEESRCL